MLLAIVNCGSPEQEMLTFGNVRYSASQILAGKIIAFSKANGVEIEPHIFWPAGGGVFPNPADFDAFIIPGSKHDIDEAGRKANPWMETLLDFIRRAHSLKKLMLGICFGHQAIGVAFGSRIRRIASPTNIELGFVPVGLTREGEADPLFSGMPKRFDTMQFHFCFINPAPRDGVVLAYGINPKIIQSFRVGKTTWGVQFHPDYSPDNLREVIGRRREYLSKATDLSRIRLDPSERLDDKVLINFLKQVLRKG